MYADDLVLSHGRVSAAKGTVTLSVGCRLNWYRALPVSCVEHLALTVDGTRLIPDAIAVELGGRQIPVPACYDAYTERGRRYGRTANLAETAELIQSELAIAHRLGFPMLRLNDAAPDLLAAILPTAERLGIRVVIELHAKPIRHPDSARLAEYFDAVQSPCLGFLQDLGAMMQAVPRPYLQWGRRSGRPTAIVEAVECCRRRAGHRLPRRRGRTAAGGLRRRHFQRVHQLGAGRCTRFVRPGRGASSHAQDHVEAADAEEPRTG